MSDLISRQAAIDAVTQHAKFLWNRFHEPCNLAGMKEAIESVPAAAREWLHNLLQDAIDANEITETQAIGIMWRAQHKGAKD